LARSLIRIQLVDLRGLSAEASVEFRASKDRLRGYYLWQKRKGNVAVVISHVKIYILIYIYILYIEFGSPKDLLKF